MRKAPIRLTTILALTALAAGCQSSAGTMPVPSGKSAALAAMEPVAIAAHRCWFASRDAAFRPYSFANELNSLTGNPRFLLVPAKNYGGRPLLVVQARSGSGEIEMFGPLLSEPLGSRIAADVGRWKAGDASCATAA